MNLFDELETQANDIIISGDSHSFSLYRYDPGENNVNDGFNAELTRQQTYVKNIDVAVSDSANAKIGTTRETDVRIGDFLQFINPRGKLRGYTVTAVDPTTEHSLLTMQPVREKL